MESNKEKNIPQWLCMAGLIFVIVLWGLTPVGHKALYAYYSPTIYTAIVGVVAAITMFFIARKYFPIMTRRMLRISVLTSFIYAAASILLKIGLKYTTPVKSSFLDTLSCVAVPIALFLLTRVAPSVWKILAAVVCLVGCAILTGIKIDDFSAFGIGEILCTAAALLFGVNTAVTGVFSKDICTPVHVMIQMITMSIFAGGLALVFNFVEVNGVPIEKLQVDITPWSVIGAIFMGAVAYAACWFVRIYVLKRIDATVVGVMMPMSSVVAAVFSIIVGTDTLSKNLVIGGILVVCASIISNLAGIKRESKPKKDESRDEIS